MILYIIIAAVLIVNIVNPRILWYVDSWKYKDGKKEEPSSSYLLLCRVLSLLGLLVFISAVYFRPLRLSELVSADSTIRITQQYFNVENGEPDIDSQSYNDLSEEQTENIRALFQEYRYRRTPVTLFSDGALSGLGERLSCVYIYDDNELVGTVIVSDEGGISVNDKSYVMKDASDFIRKVSLILNGTGERTVEGKI